MNKARHNRLWKLYRSIRSLNRRTRLALSCMFSMMFGMAATVEARSLQTLDASTRYVAVAGINTYQTHFSPRKGFSCAYRVAYGEESCSAYAKRAIETYGVSQAMPLVRERFASCKAAALSLRAMNEQHCGLHRHDQSKLDCKCLKCRANQECASCGCVDCSPCLDCGYCAMTAPESLPAISCADAGCAASGCEVAACCSL